MKHTVKKVAAIFAVLTLVAAIFCVSVSAAGSDGGSSSSADFSISALTKDVKAEFADAAIIGTYFQQAFDLLESYRSYHFIAFGVLALIICFFGFRLLRLFLLIAGFVGGCYGGFIVYPYVQSWFGGLPGYVELILAGVFGIACAILIHFLFRVAIVAGVGYGVFVLTASYFAGMPNALLYRIIVAVVVAILAALLLKVVFIFGTALSGGILALAQFGSGVSAFSFVLYRNDAVFSYLEPLGISSLTVGVAIGVVVGLLGILFQFSNTRRRRA